jgi:hypothetical protein
MARDHCYTTAASEKQKLIVQLEITQCFIIANIHNLQHSAGLRVHQVLAIEVGH